MPSVALVLFACPVALPQNNGSPELLFRAPSSLSGKTVVLPVGTTIEGRLDSTIGSSVSHSGDTFTITIASPVLANGTDVVISSGSQVLGAVVESIPSSHQPHAKGCPRPTGKLRVQLSGLRTPDGVTYPLVAALTGESTTSGGRGASKPNPNLGGGIGYVGTESSFQAVAPGMQNRMRSGQGQAPRVVTRQELMRDPVYGMDQTAGMTEQLPNIRSLIKRQHDIYIMEGSPVSIRLNAPFKIGMARAPVPEANFNPVVAPGNEWRTGRRFTPYAGERDEGGQAPVRQESSPPKSFAAPTPVVQPLFPLQNVPLNLGNQPAHAQNAAQQPLQSSVVPDQQQAGTPPVPAAIPQPPQGSLPPAAIPQGPPPQVAAPQDSLPQVTAPQGSLPQSAASQGPPPQVATPQATPGWQTGGAPQTPPVQKGAEQPSEPGANF